MRNDAQWLLGLLVAVVVVWLILGPLALLLVPSALVGLYVYRRRGPAAAAVTTILIFAVLVTAVFGSLVATDRSSGLTVGPETQQGP